jgi:hypothetical protein
MLARLFLAVLIALLALPAAAMPACHAPAPVVHQMDGMHHSAPAEQPSGRHATAHQACLGCIPPETGKLAAVSPPMAVPAAPAIARALAGIARGSVPPATPPPRSQ